MKRGHKTLLRRMTRTTKAKAKVLACKGHYARAVSSRKSAAIHAALLREVKSA